MNRTLLTGRTSDHARPPERGSGLHVAIIMDGNGRWAAARALPRSAGHRQGAEAVRRAVEAAPGLGIATLTLYAFSSDNWNRPPREVSALMRLFRVYLRSEVARLAEQSVRLSVIGRRDRLPVPLRAEVARAERRTAAGHTLHLRLAIDYSARDAILRAASRRSPEGALTREQFTTLLAAAYAPEPLNAAQQADGAAARTRQRTVASVAAPGVGAPDVDLLIRTGGERRLSDFLLWECAYAELYFTDRMWPDFTAANLAVAISEFHHRDRRFGTLPAVAAAG